MILTANGANNASNVLAVALYLFTDCVCTDLNILVILFSVCACKHHITIS